MLYLKLIKVNMKRSIKQYTIFMMTMTLCMTLMYAFQCLVYSEQIQVLLSSTDTLLGAITFVSILLIIIFAWLISYISGFIIKSRSKEFGLYILSGMKRRQVANMYVAEMFGMGLLAFFIGVFCGVFLTQIFQAIIVQIFQEEFSFSIDFSFLAFMMSFIYFLIMWVLTLFQQRRRLMKVTIHELLYQDDKNDQLHTRKGVILIIVFLTICLFAVGFYFANLGVDGLKGNKDHASKQLMLGMCLLIVSVYTFYYGLSGMLDLLTKRNHKLKYKKQRLLLYGHMKGRIKASRIVLATLSLLTIFTLLLSSFAIKFKDSTLAQAKIRTPYDIQISSGSSLAIDKIHTYLEKEGFQYQELYYHMYTGEQIEEAIFSDLLLSETDMINTSIYYMKESDYQTFLKMQGKEAPQLKEDDFMVVPGYVEWKIDQEELKERLSSAVLKRGDTTYHFAGLIDDTATNQYLDFLIIVPDAALKGMEIASNDYIANTEPKTRVGMEDELIKLILPEDGMASIYVKEDYKHVALTSFVSITFALFYLAFVFVCVAATIMATQQMMDVNYQKQEYIVLRKLGVEQKAVRKMLKNQIAVYFLVPLVLPIVYIIPVLYLMDGVFENLPGDSNIYLACLGSAGLFLLIYLCYYVLAYLGCKKSIE